jgi:hypothetical protein
MNTISGDSAAKSTPGKILHGKTLRAADRRPI